MLHAAGKAYPRPRAACAPATRPPRPTRSSARARTTRCAPCCDACAGHGVAVVPFGGGTSVVGGVEPLRGDLHAAIALDLAGLNAVDERRRAVADDHRRAGPDAARSSRRSSRRSGLTLGHFPQSYEYATVGGCVATRSAGQASTGYGRIDELVLGARLAAPAGDVDAARDARQRRGPGPARARRRQRGRARRHHPRGAARRARARRRRDTRASRSSRSPRAPRRCARSSRRAPRPTSRACRTRRRRACSSRSPAAARSRGSPARTCAPAGVAGGCIAICGWEGASDSPSALRAVGDRALLRDHGAVPLGASPGRAWARGRYHGPYLRDDLLDRGVFVETLETADAVVEPAPPLRARRRRAARGARPRRS